MATAIYGCYEQSNLANKATTGEDYQFAAVKAATGTAATVSYQYLGILQDDGEESAELRPVLGGENLEEHNAGAGPDGGDVGNVEV